MFREELELLKLMEEEDNRLHRKLLGERVELEDVRGRVESLSDELADRKEAMEECQVCSRKTGTASATLLLR